MESERRPALAPGEKIRDTYEVESFLGAGAYGDVYRVQHAFLGPQALKLVEVGPDAPPIDELLNEARVLAEIVHPNVVRVFDAGIVDRGTHSLPYFTMEYVPGGTLADLMKRRLRLDVQETLDVGIQLLDALSAAHGLFPPVLHRDITPGNILIAREAPLTVKLSDFGLAAHVHPETRLLRAAGTIRYQPPEAALGYATQASDLFAVGLVMYEILTGVPAFPLRAIDDLGSSVGVARAIRASRETPAQPPSRFRPGLPSGIDSAIGTALALAPADRFTSALDFGEALQRLRSE